MKLLWREQKNNSIQMNILFQILRSQKNIYEHWLKILSTVFIANDKYITFC